MSLKSVLKGARDGAQVDRWFPVKGKACAVCPGEVLGAREIKTWVSPTVT